MAQNANEVWVTGVGLVSSLGEDTAAHIAHLTAQMSDRRADS